MKHYKKMKQFKIRCSQISQIMTNDKSGKGIGKTVESYLDGWIKEQLYSRRKEFTSKYTDKGNRVEPLAIDFIADVLDFGMLIKNEQEFENEYLTGTPDVITTKIIIDNKSPWDCFTFPLFETKINEDYFYQGQGYMSLTGRNEYKLIYTLMDASEEEIFNEAQKHCYKNDIELDDEVLQYFTKKMTYTDIPNELRIKVYDFQKDDEIIQKIYNRVELCRQYISDKLSSSNFKTPF